MRQKPSCSTAALQRKITSDVGRVSGRGRGLLSGSEDFLVEDQRNAVYSVKRYQAFSSPSQWLLPLGRSR